MAINSLEDIWSAICEECKKTISQVAFDCFLKDLKPVSLDSGEFIISINNSYMRGVVEQNYSQVLKNAIKSVMGIEMEVRIIFEDRDVHPINAARPIVVTLLGMLTDFKDEHFSNAHISISLTFSVITMEDNGDPWKDPQPIIVVDIGVVYDPFLPDGYKINFFWSLENTTPSIEQ